MNLKKKAAGADEHIVAVALDDVMVYGFFVLVHSLAKNSHAPFRLLVGHFTSRLSEANQKLIVAFLHELGIENEMLELTPHPLFTERRHLTITTFSKFVISDQIAAPHLWLDLDTVAREGWDDIFTPLFAATDSTSLVVAEKLESPHTRFDGFNAGVLGWTRAKRADWVPALASLPEKRFSSEQYLFNTLYSAAFEKVDVRFNFLSSWHEQRPQLERASIIHFSGPIKPWHLLRRHTKAWERINPSWAAWFAAEKTMLDGSQSAMLAKPIQHLARQALFSGRLHTGKGALAGWFMRMLVILGPLGDPLVWMLQSRSPQ